MTCKVGKWLTALLVLFCLTIPVRASDVVGTVPVLLWGEAPAYEETGSGQLSLGSAIADGARILTGADLALIPTGELGGNLLPGDVTGADIAASAPETELYVLSLSTQEVMGFLETGFSHLTLDPESLRLDRAKSAWDGYPQIAGLNCRCDMASPPGKRVSRVVLSDDSELRAEDSEAYLTLVTTGSLLDGTYGYYERSGTATGKTLRDALTAQICSGGITESYGTETRVELVGHADDSLAGRYRLGTLAWLAIVLVLLTGRPWIKLMRLLRSKGPGSDLN